VAARAERRSNRLEELRLGSTVGPMAFGAGPREHRGVNRRLLEVLFLVLMTFEADFVLSVLEDSLRGGSVGIVAGHALPGVERCVRHLRLGLHQLPMTVGAERSTGLLQQLRVLGRVRRVTGDATVVDRRMGEGRLAALIAVTARAEVVALP